MEAVCTSGESESILIFPPPPTLVSPNKNTLVGLTFERQKRKDRAQKLAHKLSKIYQVDVHGLQGEKMITDQGYTEERVQNMSGVQLKERLLQNADPVYKPRQHSEELLSWGSRPKRIKSSNSHTTVSKPISTDKVKTYQVVVYGLRGEKMMIDLCNTEEQMKNMTVLQLKEKITQRLPTTAGQDGLRLIFTDKMLDGDSDLLSGYGIQHLSVIQLVVKVPGGLTA